MLVETTWNAVAKKGIVGKYVQASQYLLWAWSETLVGSALWGVPGSADFKELLDRWDFAAGLPPHDVIVDLRFLDAIDPTLFAQLVAYVRERVVAYKTRYRKQALLVPADELRAAAILGFPGVLGWGHEWRGFTDVRSAAEWLERPDVAVAPALAAVEELLTAARETSEPLRIVRAYLEAHPQTRTVEAAARAVGRSSRSLQRDLERARTSFRVELTTSRARAAAVLLRESDTKISTVAAAVGYSSRTHFNRVFVEIFGELPSAYRASRR